MKPLKFCFTHEKVFWNGRFRGLVLKKLKLFYFKPLSPLNIYVNLDIPIGIVSLRDKRVFQVQKTLDNLWTARQ